MAIALDRWLRRVLQAADPFFSKDIDRGAFWNDSIRSSLKSVRFGIVCVTPENIGAAWLNYEAGALAERLDGHTVPWLLGSKPEALKDSPMSRLQASTAEQEGTLGVVQSLNASLGKPLSDAILLDVFKDMWPKLEQDLKAIPEGEVKPKKREPEEMLEEIVGLCRQIGRDVGKPSLEELVERNRALGKALFEGDATATLPALTWQTERSRRRAAAARARSYDMSDVESFDFRRMVRELIAEEAYSEKAPVDVEALTIRAIEEIQRHVAAHGLISTDDARRIAKGQI